MARQFICHMQGLTKTYPGNRRVLEDIYLQFYPDAKIGVLGVNGSGKSTLLRIMAGIDKEFTGGPLRNIGGLRRRLDSAGDQVGKQERHPASSPHRRR
jgi:ATPase subunit of ABC transporter with duplicated ATPase domains